MVCVVAVVVLAEAVPARLLEAAARHLQNLLEDGTIRTCTRTLYTLMKSRIVEVNTLHNLHKMELAERSDVHSFTLCRFVHVVHVLCFASAGGQHALSVLPLGSALVGGDAGREPR